MDKALRAFSRKGTFRDIILAREIKSPEHARHLWPLVAPEPPHELVYYVRPSFDEATNRLRKRSYFARFPGEGRATAGKKFETLATEWRRQTSESSEHRGAKQLIVQELKNRLARDKKLIWCFADKTHSDFPFRGDLLLDATRIETEYAFQTPLDNKYRLDIAVLCDNAAGEPEILAGIEIELSHAFDGYKALIGKTMGFPIISVDINGLSLEELNAEWASAVLESTTQSSEDGRRITFIYLHDLIYPEFVVYPNALLEDPKHQYLVWSSDSDTIRLDREVKALAEHCGYGKNELSSTRVTSNSEQSRKQVSDLGDVVGPDWRELNENQCLRISIDRPSGVDDLRAHRFHRRFARLILQEPNALVGYKYMGRVKNHGLDEELWIHSQWMGAGQDRVLHRMLPKRLCEPMSRIIAIVQRATSQS